VRVKREEKEALFQKVLKQVPYIISRYTVDAKDIEDLTQAAYHKLWLRLDKYDPARGEPTTFTHWVVTSVVLHYFNKTNRRSKHEQSLDAMEDAGFRVPHKVDEATITRNRAKERLAQILSLPVFDGELALKVKNVLKLMMQGYTEKEAIEKLKYQPDARKITKERLRIFKDIRDNHKREENS